MLACVTIWSPPPPITMPLINLPDSVKKSSANSRISQGLESLLIGGSGSSGIKSFEATYKIGRKLMGGSYGTVYEGVNIKTKREFAIKVIERRYAIFSCHCPDVLHLLTHSSDLLLRLTVQPVVVNMNIEN